MRWSLVCIALCACKGDAPKKTPKVDHVAPSGPQRFAEVDAAIDAMRPALLLAEPTETVSACKGPLEVVAIDHEAALLIAAGRPAPQGAELTTPPEIAAVVRYASKATLSAEDVTAIQAWAKARPAVWGFLDSAVYEGAYEGVLHVVDGKTRTVLCHTQVKAPSPDKAQVAQALADKLAQLRAGTDVVVVPDPLLDNRGPAVDVSRIPPSATRSSPVCLTYRDIAAEKDAFACQPTMRACMKRRAELRTDPNHTAVEVSACTDVANAKPR